MNLSIMGYYNMENFDKLYKTLNNNNINLSMRKYVDNNLLLINLI
jgi:hypothetical protein